MYVKFSKDKYIISISDKVTSKAVNREYPIEGKSKVIEAREELGHYFWIKAKYKSEFSAFSKNKGGPSFM